MHVPRLMAGFLAALSITYATIPAHGGEPKLTIVNPSTLYDPTPHGYSHAVVASGGRRIVHISGQTGGDLAGKFSPDFGEQVKQAYANLRAALTALGATPAQVPKITTYIVGYDESKLDILTRNIKETFGGTLPALTLVPVPRLALDVMLFEVEAFAILE